MIKQLAGLALFLPLGIFACNAPGKPDAQVVVVHCYQDMNAPFEPWLIKVAYEFSMTQPRTKNEKPIIIATLPTNDFEKTLSDTLTRLHPDLIIVSSASQIPQNLEISKELKKAKNICPSQSPCLALIPAWVQGDQRDATKLYIDFLFAHR